MNKMVYGAENGLVPERDSVPGITGFDSVGHEDGFDCPVCGRWTFKKIGDYEICPKCGWENDRLQYKDPDLKGGANSLSLNEARQKYLLHEGKEVVDE